MLTIVSDKKNKKVLEVSGINLDFSDNLVVKKYKDVLSKNAKISPEDISLLTLDDETIEARRIRSGAEYGVVWENGKINRIDFSADDSKHKFKVTLSSNTVTIGESVTLSIQLFESDGRSKDVNNNNQFRLPVIGPIGNFFTQFNLINGFASRTVSFNNCGTYVFGANRVDNLVAIGEPLTLDVDM